MPLVTFKRLFAQAMLESIGLAVLPLGAHVLADPLGFKSWYRGDFSLFELILCGCLVLATFFEDGMTSWKITVFTASIIGLLAAAMVYGSLESADLARKAFYEGQYDRWSGWVIGATIAVLVAYYIPRVLATIKVDSDDGGLETPAVWG